MTRITGYTRPFAVLGHPIGHTLSPVMHNAAYRAAGLDAVYLAFDVPPEKLDGVLRTMADMGFGGVNLTVPLKEVGFRGLPDLADSARLLGAVNTVEFRDDGTLRGHNTDGAGFLAAIREAFDCRVQGRTLFVLGCGGAGRAVALTAGADKAARLLLADTDAAKRTALAADLRRQCPGLTVEEVLLPEQWPALCREADLVVQATPIGMKRSDPSPLPPEAFRAGQHAFDLVYMFPETGFLRAARHAGANVANGLGMLLHQGAAAFEIWFGMKAPTEVMRTTLEHEVYGTTGT